MLFECWCLIGTSFLNFVGSDEFVYSATESPKSNRLGFYNVQTGDEFFLHGFDVRPKFKTKQKNRDFLQFQYYSQITQRPKYTYSTTSRSPTRNTIKISRKPIIKKRPNQIINSVNNNKNRRKIRTTRRPNYTTIKTKIPKRRPNKNQITPIKIKLSSNCNKANNNKKQKNTNNKRKNNKHMGIKKPPNPTINIIKKYVLSLQKYRKENNGNKTLENFSTRQRKMFNFPSFEDIKNSTVTLSNRFLSIFHVIQYDNYECRGNNELGEYKGICYSEMQCVQIGGFPIGNCAGGYGVCCIFRISCGNKSSRNLTYLESPNYPNFYPYSIETSTQQINPEQTETPTQIPTTPESGTEEVTTPESDTEEVTTPPDVEIDIDEEDLEADEDKAIENYGDSIDLDDEFVEHLEHDFLLKEPREGDFSDSLACVFWIYKISNDVKQIRIDFVDLELRGTTQNGDCFEEMLVVSGENIRSTIPIICGYNSVYIDVSSLLGPLQISILSTTGNNKRFQLLTTQLTTSCSSLNDCLQYYDSINGQISSFNYDTSNLMRSIPQYMNNLNYVICIQRRTGYCSITYDTGNINGERNQFEIVNSLGLNNSEVETQEVPDDCSEDYIVLANKRVCGQMFDNPIIDNSPGPIVITVRSDEQLSGRGFKVNFRQNRCIKN